MKRGKFIVIEGGDGSGKDTQIELLKKSFPETKVVYTRDPGGTEFGQSLKQILSYGKEFSRKAEVMLFLAARAQLVDEVILPSIKKGKHVISNRFDPSTVAYQIYGREQKNLAKVFPVMRDYIREGARPDLLIFLDVEPKTTMERVNARAEKRSRFEKEKLEFHARVRKGYLQAVKEHPHAVVIDGNQDIEAVHREVLVAVSKVLGK